MPQGWEEAARAGWMENPVARAVMAKAWDIPAEALTGPSPDGLPDHWTDAAPITGRRSLGQVAYEAYCEATAGVSLISGVQLPTWADQVRGIRDAWDCAAHAVARVAREVA
jgi:hypothetical protein